MRVRLDHCVIAVSDWEQSNAFYRTVLGAEVLSRGSGSVYRFGNQQLNVHGPGMSPAPVARIPVEPGSSDLCFTWAPSRMPLIISARRASPSKTDPSTATAPVATAPVCTSGIQTGRCSNSSPTNQVDGEMHDRCQDQVARRPTSNAPTPTCVASASEDGRAADIAVLRGRRSNDGPTTTSECLERSAGWQARSPADVLMIGHNARCFGGERLTTVRPAAFELAFWTANR